MEKGEKIIVANEFGTVSNEKVIVNMSNSREIHIPLKQIYSISFRRKHNIIPAIFYFVLCISLLIGVFIIEGIPELFDSIPKAYVIIAILITSILFLVSMFQYMGHHIIRINEVGDDRKFIKVKLSKTKDGREFSQAIEHLLTRQ